jgi:hypothetical protein
MGVLIRFSLTFSQPLLHLGVFFFFSIYVVFLFVVKNEVFFHLCLTQMLVPSPLCQFVLLE